MNIDWDWIKKEIIRKEKISNSAIGTRLDECIKKAKSLAAPKTVSIEKDVLNINPASVEIEGQVIFSGERLSAYMKSAKLVHIFLVTLGPRLEEEASLIMKKGDELGGYLLDRIGSLAVELLAESMERTLRDFYSSQDSGISMRMSPGYCDWPIEEQTVVNNVLDFSKAGVVLTESYMMVPRKSISAMVGIGPKNTFAKNKSQCVVCDKKDCEYRRTS